MISTNAAFLNPSIQFLQFGITTNEPTICQYSDQEFEFGSGIPMTNENSIKHEASLGNTIFIIKCQDEFNNEAIFTVFP